MTVQPSHESLGHKAELVHSATFPLLGVPVEIRSNSVAVIAAAELAFGRWRSLAPELIAPVAPALVEVIVQPADPALLADEPRPFVHRVHGGRFIASDGVNMLSAQYDQGRALAVIGLELLPREEQLRDNVLRLLALLLVTQHDRVPVHAGAVVHDGLAILLAGRSTAGKSTLSYACLRDGFQLLAEDVVYVSRTPALRLWGLPDLIHLLPDAVGFFPELAEVPAKVQANGKYKLAVETARFGADRAVCHAERAVVCVLERHAAAATRLEPIEPAQAIAVLSGNREPGFDLYEGTSAVAEALAAGGAYRMTVGHDLSSATAALRDLARSTSSSH